MMRQITTTIAQVGRLSRPDNWSPTYLDRTDLVAPSAKANPPPKSSATPQGNLFCTNCQSSSEGATRDSAAEVKGQKLSSEGKMKRRKTISIAEEASSTTWLSDTAPHSPTSSSTKKSPHPGMNLGSLKNQSATRTVKCRSTASCWKVMGPSSAYFLTSSFLMAAWEPRVTRDL